MMLWIIKILSQGELSKLWSSLDVNGNGIVSLAEFDRWVVNAYPLLNHKPALMRAFMRTTKTEGGGEDFVHRKDFATVCLIVLFANDL